MFARKLFALLLVFASCGFAFGQAAPIAPVTLYAPTHPTVAFMTDFGRLDDAVAICRAVMLGIDPAARIEDITHEVTPFSIYEGARFLSGVAPYYPAGTVFVVVVDPGVGSNRKAVVAKSKKGQYFVLPDNGLLTFVQERDGIESVREIKNTDYMIGAALSSTFHGRDIFSPVGAHITHGDDWTKVGPEMDPAKLVRLQNTLAQVAAEGIIGEVIGTDGPFGNLITNITREQFEQLGYKLGDNVRVVVNQRQVEFPFVRTFSDVPVGKPLFYIDSRGRLGMAVNQGNFEKAYQVTAPSAISIPKKPAR
jgi:S-adenosylmethionine hydrolase